MAMPMTLADESKDFLRPTVSAMKSRKREQPTTLQIPYTPVANNEFEFPCIPNAVKMVGA